jgi:hypothetical protein
VFFTIAANILWTYVLPCLPALALLAAGWTAAGSRPQQVDRLLAIVLVVLAMVIPASLFAIDRSGKLEGHSLRGLVRAYDTMAKPGEELLEVPSVSFSTDFYAQGRARGIRFGEDLPELPAGRVVYVIIANDRWFKMPASLREQAAIVATTPSHKLFRWPGTASAAPAGTPSAGPAGTS